MADFNDFINDLQETDLNELAQSGSKKGAATVKFECVECKGTGFWAHGKTNKHGNDKCWTCGGRGFTVTDPRKLKENRQKAAQKKADAIEANRAANLETGLVKSLSEIEEWNSFAASMMTQHMQGKRAWSEKQVAAARSMLAKIAAKREAKAAAKEAAATAVDLSAIANMFATAAQSGYKKPMYRANGLRIKPGKAGALYVMTEDRMEVGFYGESPAYEGKIVDGKFYGVRATAEATPEKLLAIAADPKGEAIRHGQRTGTCSCCGRELTKHASIEAGIGPICAEKWGL